MTSFARLVLLCAALAASNAFADAVVTACGKDVWPGDPRVDFAEALAAGGRITFACSGIVEFTKTHGFTGDTQIDGGGKITLDGKGRRMFGLGSSGARVSFSHIRIQNAGTPPGSIPGGVIAGEGFVSFLAGTSIRKSDRPVWMIAGDLDVRDAVIAENTGPVLIVSEGKLTITEARFSDNKGQLLATGPLTNVTIHDTQFFRNGHSDFGGAAAGDCEVVVTASWFMDNADAEDGGAFRSRCRTRVEDTQFERNRTNGDGGAIFLTRGSATTMRKVQFRGNQAGESGGAIAAVWALGQSGALRIQHGRFENNTAVRAGGALIVGESSLVEIGAGGFIANSAGTAGGAIYVRQSLLSAASSLFRRNRAHSGGAIQALCMPAVGRVVNSIIAENVTETTGGAYYGGNMHFLNTTIIGNGNASVQHGELCGAPATIEFVNTILQGGIAGTCAGADAQRTFMDLGNNIQYPYWTCGSTIASAYPLLGPFFAPLRPVSPAGSAGNNTRCESPPINGRDIFGTHRPQGSQCSIGAVEGDLTTIFTRWWKRRHLD